MTERDHRDQAPMRKVGVLWKPRDGARSLGSGSLTVQGMKQRFVILENRYKQKPTDPDYVLMSADAPEPDPYADRDQARRPRQDEPDDRRFDDQHHDDDRRGPARPRETPRRTPW